MIVDTDILIWVSRGNASAAEFLRRQQGFAVSAVTYMEVAQGVRDKRELDAFRKALGLWGASVLPINEAISQHATFYVECYALSHSMCMADALIAATAVHHGDALATGNVRHYRFIPDLTCVGFDPNAPTLAPPDASAPFAGDEPLTPPGSIPPD